MKNLRNANTIDEAKNIVIESNNKSLYDFFVLCLQDIDNMKHTIEFKRLSIDSTAKFKCELFDVISALLSN